MSKKPYTYPTKLFKVYVNNGFYSNTQSSFQSPEIFYTYTDLTALELSNYLIDNKYIILSNECLKKHTLVPTLQILYIEEISHINTDGERIYLFDGQRDYKFKSDSTLAYKLFTTVE
ncbi:hypothetical protein [Romboutsia sp.]|uniref:hypothetical protein n=1 Tax=Romboutsia sp. TaxID=1965302 RepID=UPI003F3393C5